MSAWSHLYGDQYPLADFQLYYKYKVYLLSISKAFKQGSGLIAFTFRS